MSEIFNDLGRWAFPVKDGLSHLAACRAGRHGSIVDPYRRGRRMRTAALIVLFSMAAPMPCAAALMPADPSAYRPHEGDFSIDFPKTPDAGNRLTGNGRERVYMDNEGDQLFLVTVVNYYLGGNSSEAVFNERLRKFALADDATLVSSRKVDWAGEPAWEATLSAGVSDIILRMTMHRGRLYQAIYQGLAHDVREDQGRKFLESLRWTDGVPAGKPGSGTPPMGNVPLKAEAAVRPAASS